MSERAWFVTSLMHPDVALDGPFVERDECEARCLLRTDRQTVLRAFVAGRLPSHYVPRLFPIGEGETLQLYRAEARAARGTVERSGARETGALPAIVHTYTRGGLLALCKALELRAPVAGADRAGIIEHIESELRALARGGASRG